MGAYLLALWAVPGWIVEVVAFPHEQSSPPQPTLDLATAVHLADFLAHEVAVPAESGGEPPPRLNPALLESSKVVEQLPAWRAMAQRLGQG